MEDIGLRATLQGANAYISDAKKIQTETGKMGNQMVATAKDSQKASSSLVGSLKGVAVAFAGAFVATKVVSGIKDAINAASDLSETINKVNVVFGDAADSVLKFGKNSTQALGLSENAALSAAGNFGNLFTNIGLTRAEAADFSKVLLQNAADLASFNNIDPTEVLDKLRAGLVGEAEPLRILGIDVSETRIKIEAMAQGITKSTERMTQAEKVALRYAAIQSQMGNAAGDFARTSTGLANSQRILTGVWEDMMASIGAAFVPVIAQVTSGLAKLLLNVKRWFDDNQDIVERWAAAIAAGVSVVIDSVGWLAGAFGQAFSEILSIVSSIGQAIYEALQWLNPFATHSPSLVSSVINGVNVIKTKFGELDAVRNVTRAAGMAMQALGAAINQGVSGFRQLPILFNSATFAIEDFIRANGDIKGAVSGMQDIVEALTDSVKGYETALRDILQTPIEGSKEFEDRLFDLEQQEAAVQKRLNDLKLSNAPKEEVEKLEDELSRLRLQADNVRLEEKLKLDPLRKQLKDLASEVKEQPFDVLKKGILDSKNALAQLTPQLSGAEAALKVLQQIQKETPATSKAGGGGGAGGGVLGAIADQAKSAQGAVKDLASGIDSFKAKLDETKTRIEQAFKPFREAVDEYVLKPLGYVGNLIKMTLAGEPMLAAKLAAQDLNTAWEDLETTWNEIDWDELILNIDILALKTDQKWVFEFTKAWRDLDPTLDRIGNLFGTLSKTIAGVSGETDIGRDANILFTGGIRTTVNGINELTRVLEILFTGVANWARNYTKAAGDALGDFKNLVGEDLGVAGEFFGELADTAKRDLDILKQDLDGLAPTLNTLQSTFQTVFDGIATAVATKINAVIGSINALIGTLNRIPNVNIPTVPVIPQVQGARSSGLGGHAVEGLANGGTVTRAGMFEVGERGRETVWLPRAATVVPGPARAGAVSNVRNFNDQWTIQAAQNPVDTWQVVQQRLRFARITQGR